MEYELENVLKHPKQNQEVNHDDDKPLLEGDSPDFSSSSSSSSSQEFGTKEKVSLNNSSKSQFNENLQLSPSRSPHRSVLRNASQMKYPPIQTIGRPGEYDPNRIPASIFSSKPSNPTECWSVASNESLFSIHMGNNSFSRDNAILFGKSGELPRLDDWNNPQSNIYETKSNELSNLPPVMEIPGHEESSLKAGKIIELEKEKFAANIENHASQKVAGNDVTDVKPTSINLHSSSNLSSNPRLSNESGISGNSCSSFAFPVLMTDGATSSGSLNVVMETPEKPELQSQFSKASTTPKASLTSWFTCLWWPRCC